MSFTRSIFFLVVMMHFVTIIRSQQRPSFSRSIPNDSIPPARVLDINPSIFQRHDTVWQFSGICKPLKISQYILGRGGDILPNPGTVGKSAIVIHGNVDYDFLYRSYADTPYYQKDFRQHTIRTSMTVTVKENYSYRVNLVGRISNSPYFKNFFDAGLQFDRYASLAKLKQSAENKIAANAPQMRDLQATEAALKEQIKKYNGIKNSLSRPGIAQLIIEERERNYYNETHPQFPKGTNKTDSTENKIKNYVNDKKQGVDSLKQAVSKLEHKADSAEHKVTNYINEKKQELDSLQKSIAKLQHKADSLKNRMYKETNELKQKIAKATNPRELKKVMVDNNIPEDKKAKWEKTMADIKSIGIGRSLINYSELTVDNVSLTGINVEYNPRMYAAFAAGKIDYGFRDFMGRNKFANKQNLLMGRIGWGDKDKMAVILSVFTGRKYNYGSVLNDTVNGYINVTGYSVEGILKKNENVGISAEVAKSTRPITGSLSTNKETNSLFRFSDRSNQAISIKAQTIIPETNTRLSGFFRKSGENFQSFSLFTYNTDQTAWALKADQSFLKNKIGLTAMLRRNDFTNPFTLKTFKTSTVFTSVQLNVRIPKWPSVSIGYHPGSQLYFIDRDRIRENVYYILNGSVIHSYSLFGIRMMSSAIYNHYSNKGTDSGFVNYSGKHYILSHALLFRKIQLSANYIHTDQQELKFFTLEANADYFPASFFRIGAGGKYNRTQFGKVYWGGMAQVMLEIKKLGGLQLQYEKSFLPTIYQSLFPVETGRVSWFKYF